MSFVNSFLFFNKVENLLKNQQKTVKNIKTRLKAAKNCENYVKNIENRLKTAKKNCENIKNR